MADGNSTTPSPKRKRPVRTALALAAILVLALAAFVSLMTFSLDSSRFGGDKVALIRIEGVIVDSREVIEELRRYKENPSIKAIVLRIDSPGGGVVPSQEIYTEVRRVRADGRIKLVASMGNVAASGGYYIAAATDKIVANPGTLTGSIGVIMELANVKDLLEKVGVQSVVIKSGRYKDLASPFRTMSADEQALLQGVLDDVHAQFIEAVADGRSLNINEIHDLADGRIFSGRQAKRLNLVDELGDLQDAIKLAARLVGIPGEPHLVEARKRFSLRSLLDNLFAGKLSPLIPSDISLKYMLAL